MCWMATQLEDLEVLVYHMGESLEEEAQRTANATANAKAEVKETMEALKKSNLELTFELSEMDHKVFARDAQIAQLVKTLTLKDVPQQSTEEEEEPMERVRLLPGGLEVPITPPEESVPKKRCPGNAAEYRRRLRPRA